MINQFSFFTGNNTETSSYNYKICQLCSIKPPLIQNSSNICSSIMIMKEGSFKKCLLQYNLTYMEYFDFNLRFLFLIL